MHLQGLLSDIEWQHLSHLTPDLEIITHPSLLAINAFEECMTYKLHMMLEYHSLEYVHGPERGGGYRTHPRFW